MNRKAEGKKLRRGYATGTCLTAAALGAWRAWRERRTVAGPVTVRMPDGGACEIPLRAAFYDAGRGFGLVRKQAGDDPDVTDKALFRVAFFTSPRPAGIFDLELACDRCRLVVSGLYGLGLVTRPGLDAECGHWAINPVPRKMLVENLRLAGCGSFSGNGHLEVAIPDGRRLAARTLNPVLGVVDGLSILGTSGYVEPYSHEAYVRTIRILLAGARRAGCGEVALCTGGRTARAVARDLPRLPEYAVVRIADFIADSLKLAAAAGFARVIVACMVGKLYKYASGFKYTHAHTVRSDCAELAQIATGCGVEEAEVGRILRSGSVREALSRLAPQAVERVEEELGRRALSALRGWLLGPAEIELRLYSPAGELKRIWRNS